MDHDGKDQANGPSATVEEEPARGRFITAREKTKSLTWRRVVVYDCDRNTVEVKRPFKLDHSMSSKPPLSRPNSSPEEYESVNLPSGLSQVTIFLDSETATTPTTEETTEDGDSNVRLAKIYLNKLGFLNSVLRSLGQLSTLYVKKIEPWS